MVDAKRTRSSVQFSSKVYLSFIHISIRHVDWFFQHKGDNQYAFETKPDTSEVAEGATQSFLVDDVFGFVSYDLRQIQGSIITCTIVFIGMGAEVRQRLLILQCTDKIFCRYNSSVCFFYNSALQIWGSHIFLRC